MLFRRVRWESPLLTPPEALFQQGMRYPVCLGLILEVHGFTVLCVKIEFFTVSNVLSDVCWSIRNSRIRIFHMRKSVLLRLFSEMTNDLANSQKVRGDR